MVLYVLKHGQQSGFTAIMFGFKSSTVDGVTTKYTKAVYDRLYEKVCAACGEKLDRITVQTEIKTISMVRLCKVCSGCYNPSKQTTSQK